MAKSRQQKEVSVKDLTEKFQRMKSVVFSTFAGLSVKDSTQLRQTLRDQGIDYVVAKKSLMKRALADAKLDATIIDQVAGGSALAFGFEDEVMPAKLLATFAKDHEVVKLVGGVVNGEYLDESRIGALAKLPSREELVAKTVWTIKAPLTGFVNVLAGNLRGLITVLQAIKDKQPA